MAWQATVYIRGYFHSCVSLFINSFHLCLLSSDYVLGMGAHSEDGALNKTDEVPAFMEFLFWSGRCRSK